MEMAAAPDGKEWRVTVPEGASVTVEQQEAGWAARAWAWLLSRVLAFRDKVLGFGKRLWKIGADDPRRVVHGLKVGLALTLVSLFYYTRPLYDGVGGRAMWCVITAVVVFEYTVGACIYKGVNRFLATASGGMLAVGVHWIACRSGDKVEPFIRSGSVFLVAAMVTFTKFIPTVKARFDYCTTIFIMTFSLVQVSSYRVEPVIDTAQRRLSTICIGIAICFTINVLVCPVWSGEELHLATVRNMEKLAGAVEACVEDYFSAAATGTTASKPPPSAAGNNAKAEGYKAVLNSKASEDAQANLARWEPGHGKFGFHHPYDQYKNVGAAMRHCAACVEAMAGCARSAETLQAPGHARRHLADACTRVAARCARVLREAASSVSTMTTSRSLDLAVAEMNASVLELQADLKALPSKLLLLPPEAESAPEPAASLAAAAQLFTVTTLLVEVSARVEGVVDAVDTLASLAAFESAGDEKAAAESATKVLPVTNPDSDKLEKIWKRVLFYDRN